MRRTLVLALFALAAAGAGAGCGSTYTIADRDTPVEVWVAAAGAAPAADAPLVVRVGDKTAYEGRPGAVPGAPARRVGTIWVRGGEQAVSVLVGGRSVASATVSVAHRAWLVVTLSGGGATVVSADREPGSAK